MLKRNNTDDLVSPILARTERVNSKYHKKSARAELLLI